MVGNWTMKIIHLPCWLWLHHLHCLRLKVSMKIKLIRLGMLRFLPKRNKGFFELTNHFPEPFLFVKDNLIEHIFLLFNLTVEESYFSPILLKGKIKMLDILMSDFCDYGYKAFIQVVNDIFYR